MVKRLLFAVVLLALLLAAAPGMADTAFTMSERQLLGRFGVSYFVTSNYLDDDGDRRQLPDTFYREIAGHLELRWALLGRLELGFATHVQNQYLTDNFDDYNRTNLGDVEFDVLLRLLGGTRAALGVSVKGKFPFFYDESDDLPPGDGQIDVEGRVLAGLKFSLFTAAGDFGYRFRAEDPADQYVYGVEIGFAHSIVYGLLRLDGYASLGNEEKDAELRYWQHGPDYDAGYVNVKCGVKISNHWSVDLTTSYSAYGRNIAQGTTLILGTNVVF